MKEKNRICRLLAVVFAIVLMTSGSITVLAATPRSTLFIDAQASSLTRTENTELKVYYYVDSLATLDKLGAFSISIQKSLDQQTWQTEKAYYYWTNPEFVDENTYVHSGTLYHNGTRGYYYRAEITFFASKAGSGEKTYMTTKTVYIPPLGNGGRTN